MKILNLILFNLTATFLLQSQDNIPWFNPHSTELQEGRFLDAAGDCKIVKEGFDNNLNVIIKQFESLPLFIHTPQELKKWMKENHLIEGSAAIYQADKNNFLILEIKINSENARNSYGNLEFGSKMKCFLNDGSSVYLKNLERSKGQVNKSEKFTKYNGVYALENDDLKSLKNRSLDKIGIIWDKGYQEYEIQNVQLIQSQIKCLTK